MCFIGALIIPMVIRVRAPWLSQLIGSSGESFWEPWISCCTWSNHFASLEASDQAMNSASRVDFAIRLCFRDCHRIASFQARNTRPPSDLWSAPSFTESKPDYLTRLLQMSMPMPVPVPMPMPLPLMCSPKSAVDLRYWGTLLAAVIRGVNCREL